MSNSLSRLHAKAALITTVWRGPTYETVALGSPVSLGSHIGLPTGYAHSAALLLSQGFHAGGEKGILGGGVSEDKDV